MIDDTAALVYKALEQAAMINVIANNRAYGSAPALDQAIALRVLIEEEKRAREKPTTAENS